MAKGDRAIVVLSSAASSRTLEDPVRIDAHGLDGWLARYGITLERNVLLEPRSTRRWLGDWVPALLAVDPSPMRALGGGFAAPNQPEYWNVLAMTHASSLIIHPEAQPEARFEVILRPSPGTRAFATDGLRPTKAPFDEGTAGEHIVGVAVSGPLRIAGGSAHGRLIVFSSHITANSYVDSKAQDTTRRVLRDAIGWARGDETLHRCIDWSGLPVFP
jgi:hypothetical protein